MTGKAIQVNSEIGRLKTVLVKRPGPEVENITPDSMERLLFDDIPFLKIAQQEHDYFTDVLRKHGAKVFYIDQLASETLALSGDIRNK